MKKTFKIAVMAALAFSTISLSISLPALAEDLASSPGAKLFAAKACNACHGFGKKMSGPDLKALFQRRDEAWVKKWIQDPITMAKTDPIGQKLLAEWKIQMPKPMITEAELGQLMDYLKKASQ